MITGETRLGQGQEVVELAFCFVCTSNEEEYSLPFKINCALSKLALKPLVILHSGIFEVSFRVGGCVDMCECSTHRD